MLALLVQQAYMTHVNLVYTPSSLPFLCSLNPLITTVPTLRKRSGTNSTKRSGTISTKRSGTNPVCYAIGHEEQKDRQTHRQTDIGKKRQ